MDKFDVDSSNHFASGDQFSNWIDDQSGSDNTDNDPSDPLDSEANRNTHHRLLEWFYLERERQAENRLEMAMDADFYDNLQWDPIDAQLLRDRGQMPLVYNEVAPMVDWIIGTERRGRVDWSVLPRTEDDVEAADIKTKVMKYVSDINHVPYVRSRAFADAVKVGIGWLDDGVRDDPTQDPLYSKYEDWRNVLWDSTCYDLDLTDARYVFRWRWVDEDVALMMFPNRQRQVYEGVEDAGAFQSEMLDDTWNYLTEQIERNGKVFASGSGMIVDAKRRRIKLIECQFKLPVKVRIVADGPLKGAFVNSDDQAMAQAIQGYGSEIVDKVAMRVHFAVFTEKDLLSLSVSPYRHNKFSLTPIWCYRKNRDRLPYGIIRRVRDIQQDLNKRASKALFMLNTNQIIMDKNAVDDPSEARDEVDRPDGMIVKNAGKEFTIRRDTDAATGQIQMMTLAATSIQKSAGVTQENMGRPSNAVSGIAIQARQLQGSVVTTEPFDNLRLAVQLQGEKQLSLSEQYYTEEKAVRLTGAKGSVEWVKINTPEIQPDGSVRWLNDITNSIADFVVSEQDYAGTMRQVMFDSLNNMSSKLPPELALKLLTIAMDYSDMPNHEEIAAAIRQATGQPDPNKKPTPEEQQQQAQQQQQQDEAVQMAKAQAMAMLAKTRAEAAKINADAQKITAEAQNNGGLSQEHQQAIQKVQSDAANQIEKLSEQLRKAQNELTQRTLALNNDNDLKLELAKIESETKIRVAEIGDKTNAKMQELMVRLAELEQGSKVGMPVDANSAPNSAPPKKKSSKKITVHRDENGNISHLTAQEEGADEKNISVNRDANGNMTGAHIE